MKTKLHLVTSKLIILPQFPFRAYFRFCLKPTFPSLMRAYYTLTAHQENFGFSFGRPSWKRRNAVTVAAPATNSGRKALLLIAFFHRRILMQIKNSGRDFQSTKIRRGAGYGKRMGRTKRKDEWGIERRRIKEE